MTHPKSNPEELEFMLCNLFQVRSLHPRQNNNKAAEALGGQTHGPQ